MSAEETSFERALLRADIRAGNTEAAEMQLQRVKELEALDRRWRELLNHADESDGTGEHVGFARYYRAKADGVLDAIQILRDTTEAG